MKSNKEQIGGKAKRLMNVIKALEIVEQTSGDKDRGKSYITASKILAEHIRKELEDLKILKGSVTELNLKGQKVNGCEIHRWHNNGN